MCAADYFGRPWSIPERVEHRARHDQRGGQWSCGQQHRRRRPDDDGGGQYRGQRDRRRSGVHHGGRGPEDGRPNDRQTARPQLPRSAPAVQLRTPVRRQGRCPNIEQIALRNRTRHNITIILCVVIIILLCSTPMVFFPPQYARCFRHDVCAHDRHAGQSLTAALKL